jgi:tRNA splicing ligase
MGLRLESFDEEVLLGSITKRFSSNDHFCVFNYTVKTQFEKNWNNITLNSRGTIFDVSTRELVARGLPKFFNVGETEENQLHNLDKLSIGGFQAADKLDGSCGMVFYDCYQDKLCVATRGSFQSEQAIWATNFLNTQLSASIRYGLRKLIGQYENTPIVEIIYPENKIIVDYGDMCSLSLIQVVNNATGDTIPFGEVVSIAVDIGMDHVLHCENIYDLSQLKCFMNEISGIEKEGWVVRFENGHLVKFKTAKYLEMARTLRHFGPKVVFNLAKSKQTVIQHFIDNELPDALFEASNKYYNAILLKAEEYKRGLYDDFGWVVSSVGNDATRKDYALFMKENNSAWLIGVFFDWRNGKDISEFIWNKMLDYRDFEWEL